MQEPQYRQEQEFLLVHIIHLHVAANHSMQAKAHNTMLGGAFSLNVNNDEENPTNFYLGSWYRFKDAIDSLCGT